MARRIPLITNGEVLGVMGKDLFDNMHDLFAVAKQAQASNKNASSPVLKSFPREAKYTFDQILTQDPDMIKVKKLAQNAAATTSTILIQGETGVGKELFAHAIHQYSKRRRGPFAALTVPLFQRHYWNLNYLAMKKVHSPERAERGNQVNSSWPTVELFFLMK